MGWKEVDDKTKKKIDSFFVACSQEHEIKYVKSVIKEEFPHLSDAKIDKAIKECCAEVPGNRPRSAFMQCLQNKLG